MLARIASVQFFGEHAQIVEDLALMRFGDAIDVGLGELRSAEPAARARRRGIGLRAARDQHARAEKREAPPHGDS